MNENVKMTKKLRKEKYIKYIVISFMMMFLVCSFLLLKDKLMPSYALEEDPPEIPDFPWNEDSDSDGTSDWLKPFKNYTPLDGDYTSYVVTDIELDDITENTDIHMYAKAMIEGHEVDVKIEDYSELFAGNLHIVSFTGSNLNLENATTMSKMFSGCSNLTSAVLEYCDFPYNCDMTYMFEGCCSLTSVNTSEWNIDQIGMRLNGMFKGCSSLTSIDISSWYTCWDKLYSMFLDCTNLQLVKLPKFDDYDALAREETYYDRTTSIRTITNFESMFYNCPNLTEIYIDDMNSDYPFGKTQIHNDFSDGGSSGYYEDARKVFFVETEEGEKVDTNIIIPRNKYTSFKNLILSYNWADDNRFIKIYEESVSEENLRYDGYKTVNVLMDWDTDANNNHISDWIEIFDITEKNNSTYTISKMKLKDSYKDYIDIVHVFSKAYLGDTENVYSVVVNDLDSLFENSAVIELYGHDFINSNNLDVNLSYLFANCYRLEEVHISDWDFSKVSNMEEMFVYCNLLKTLDTSNWDTSNVKNMSGMFSCCDALNNIDLSKWDTSSLEDASYMFYDCISLEELDLSSFNGSQIADIGAITYGCTSLETLKLCKLTDSITTSYYYEYYDEEDVLEEYYSGAEDGSFEDNINLKNIYISDIESFGKSELCKYYERTYDEIYSYIDPLNVFYVDSEEKVNTNIIIPKEKWDDFERIIKGYSWSDDNRLINIYADSISKKNLLYSEFKDSELEPDPEPPKKDEPKASSTITVGGSSAPSSYMTGYNLISNTTTSSKKFYPNNSITRAEVATILSRLNENVNNTNNYLADNYSDISLTSWYYDSVRYVLSKKYMNGYPDNTFKPNSNITRGEFAAAICRYKNINLAVSLNKNISLTDLSNEWYENYAKALCSLGYVKGYKDNTFRGNEPITRAEACAIINRVMNIDINNITNKVNNYLDIKESDWYYKDVISSSMD